MDRKELIREYKKKKPEAGIFLLSNKASGKTFVGSSLNLHGPSGRLTMELKFGGCRFDLLKEDWDKYGEESFEFIVAEKVDEKKEDVKEELKILEAIWMEKISESPHLYYYDNIARI